MEGPVMSATSVSTVTFRALTDDESAALLLDRRAVRQGRRLRHPGPRRALHRAHRRQLHRDHGAAALRDRALGESGIRVLSVASVRIGCADARALAPSVLGRTCVARASAGWSVGCAPERPRAPPIVAHGTRPALPPAEGLALLPAPSSPGEEQALALAVLRGTWRARSSRLRRSARPLRSAAD